MARVIWRRVGATALVFEVILIWSGSVASIPVGFLLCDGSGGTPDLRDQFLTGVFPGNEGTYVGGLNTRDRGHSHAIAATNAESAHTHPVQIMITGSDTDSAFTTTVSGDAGVGAVVDAIGKIHSHPIAAFTSGASSSHTHPGPPDSKAGAGSDTRPAYYALCYIRGAVDDVPIGGIVAYNGLLKGVYTTPSSTTTTLTSSIISDATATTILVADVLTDPVPFDVILGGEVVRVNSTGVDGKTWTVRRAWSGTLAAHAAGSIAAVSAWAVCDTSHGTPDLVDNFVFVFGAGGSAAVNASDPYHSSVDPSLGGHIHGTGTADTITESAHTHGVALDTQFTTNGAISPENLGGGKAASPHAHIQNQSGAATDAGSAHKHGLPPTLATIGMNDSSTFPISYQIAFLQKVA